MLVFIHLQTTISEIEGSNETQGKKESSIQYQSQDCGYPCYHWFIVPLSYAEHGQEQNCHYKMLDNVGLCLKQKLQSLGNLNCSRGCFHSIYTARSLALATYDISGHGLNGTLH